jgi:hypothetical protein
LVWLVVWFALLVSLLKCVTLDWLDCSKWIVKNHAEYDLVLSAIVAIIAISLSMVLRIGGIVLLSFCLNLSTRGVSVDNRLGAEGAKAFGDALTDNTTLTSLSLDLYCE